MIIRILFSASLFITLLCAEWEESVIVGKILQNLDFPESPSIYTPYPEFAKKLEKRFRVVNRCRDANLIILKYSEDLPDHCRLGRRAILGLDYKILYSFPNAFGAFYWKKGRPNIVIIKPRAQQLGIRIRPSLENYTEERVW